MRGRRGGRLATAVLGPVLLVSACATGSVSESRAPAPPAKTESRGETTLDKNPYAAMFPGVPTYAPRPPSDFDLPGPVELIKRGLGFGPEEGPSPPSPSTSSHSSATIRGQNAGVFDYTGSLQNLADHIEAALASEAEADGGKVGIGIVPFINKTGQAALDVEGLTRALTWRLQQTGRYELLDRAQVDRLLVEAHLNAEALIEKESFDALAGKAERDFLLVSALWGNQTKRIFQSRLISLRDGLVRKELAVRLR